MAIKGMAMRTTGTRGTTGMPGRATGTPGALPASAALLVGPIASPDGGPTTIEPAREGPR